MQGSHSDRTHRRGRDRLSFSGFLLGKRVEEARSEAAENQEFILLYRPAHVFRRLRDYPSIEGEQGGGGPHIALQSFRRQRFDQSALLADASRLATLPHRDQLAEFGEEIGCQIWTAFRPTPRVDRLPRVEPGLLGRFPVPDFVISGHHLGSSRPPWGGCGSAEFASLLPRFAAASSNVSPSSACRAGTPVVCSQRRIVT